MPGRAVVVIPGHDPIHRMTDEVDVDGIGQVELREVDEVEMFDVGVGLGAVVQHDAHVGGGPRG